MSRTSTVSSSSRRRPGGPGPSGIPEGREEVLAALRELGIRPSKTWGQSFLCDPFVADAEAALTETRAGDPVLEVGGGLGALTQALVRRGTTPLTVIERDRRLARFLRERFGGRVRVVCADALEVDVPPVSCAVGNLPYSVATPILLRWFAARVPRVVALVQREVAERLAAVPSTKAYGRLSIVARLYGDVHLYRTVGPQAFEPSPEVESRLLVHVARPGALPVPSVDAFETLVRALFSSRRKQLGNLMRRVLSTPGEAGRLAGSAGWPADWSRRRPEELPPEAFFALARCLSASR